jgi:hypothetical protein
MIPTTLGAGAAFVRAAGGYVDGWFPMGERDQADRVVLPGSPGSPLTSFHVRASWPARGPGASKSGSIRLRRGDGRVCRTRRHWISDVIRETYSAARRGEAHSVECWREGPWSGDLRGGAGGASSASRCSTSRPTRPRSRWRPGRGCGRVLLRLAGDAARGSAPPRSAVAAICSCYGRRWRGAAPSCERPGDRSGLL